MRIIFVMVGVPVLNLCDPLINFFKMLDFVKKGIENFYCENLNACIFLYMITFILFTSSLE